MSTSSEDPERWEHLLDISPEIAMPMVGARFVAGIDSKGERASGFQIHFDPNTITPIEVVGLVQTSLWEWLHNVLHDRLDGDSA